MPVNELSRRNFLAKSSAAALALSPFWGQKKPIAPKKVAVIGAGISGLTCAQTLKTFGYDVQVFEARSRVGGRLNTDLSFGYPVELGSAWTLANGNNGVVAAQVAEKGIELFIDPFQWMIHGDDGKNLSNAYLSAIMDKVKDTLTEAKEKGSKLGFTPSMRNGLMSLEDSVMTESGTRFGLSLEIEALSGAELDDLALWWNPAPYMGRKAAPKGGWAAYINKVANGLEIHYQETVQGVTWSESGVQIDLEGSTVTTDFAVICVPLGVMKSRDFNLTGDMPENWKNSLDRIHSGTHERVVMEFNKAHWPLMNRLADTVTAGQPCLWFEPLANDVEHPVIVGVLAGRTVEKDWGSAAVDQLRAIVGSNLPDPIRVKATNWTNDPFTLGSTSYPAVGCHYEDFATVSLPLGNRVFVAGDYTSRAAAGTVHGAYTSGLRAAGQVIKA